MYRDTKRLGEAYEGLISRTGNTPHPLCVLLRRLRDASGKSLRQIEQKSGIPSVVLGAYERGDREPPLRKLDAALRTFGYAITAVPIDVDAVPLSEDIVAELRRIADQLEARDVHGAADRGPDAAPRARFLTTST